MEKTMNNQPSTNKPATNSTTGPATNPSSRRLSPKLLLLILIVIAVGLAIGLTNHRRAGKAITSPVPMVSITKSGFFPKLITIKAGQSVTWTDYDSKPHSIASDPYPKNDKYPGLNSQGPLQLNDTYTYSFEKTGTYTYHDDLNPYKLQGTVVVE